jgi:hypothetical protein
MAVVGRYLGPAVRPGDIAILGQKLVSITQGRLVPLDAARPRLLARLLSSAVRRSAHGLGLGRPQTMEMALREVGTLRILWASAFGLWDHLTGQSGHFYRTAGWRVASIDGPGPDTLPPYDRYVVLAPRTPDRECRRVARLLGCAVALVDANDLATEVLGASPGVRRDTVAALLRDNPMGQGRAQTPFMILRPLPARAHAPGHADGIARPAVMPVRTGSRSVRQVVQGEGADEQHQHHQADEVHHLLHPDAAAAAGKPLRQKEREATAVQAGERDGVQHRQVDA